MHAVALTTWVGLHHLVSISFRYVHVSNKTVCTVVSISFAVRNFIPFSAAGGLSVQWSVRTLVLLVLFSGVILKVISSCDTH